MYSKRLLLSLLCAARCGSAAGSIVQLSFTGVSGTVTQVETFYVPSTSSVDLLFSGYVTNPLCQTGSDCTADVTATSTFQGVYGGDQASTNCFMGHCVTDFNVFGVTEQRVNLAPATYSFTLEIDAHSSGAVIPVTNTVSE